MSGPGSNPDRRHAKRAYYETISPCHLPVVVHDGERVVVSGRRIRERGAVVLLVRRLHPERDRHRTHVVVHAFQEHIVRDAGRLEHQVKRRVQLWNRELVIRIVV